jgi:cell division protease FtsH
MRRLASPPPWAGFFNLLIDREYLPNMIDNNAQEKKPQGIRARAALWTKKSTQRVKDMWRAMSDGQRISLAIFIGLAGVCAGMWTQSLTKQALVEKYASAPNMKIQVQGLIGPADKLTFPTDPAVALLKKDKQMRVAQFHNAREAQGPVDKLFLFKGAGATVAAKMLSFDELAMAREYMNSADRLDRWQFVDYETLSESEKEAAQGLAMSLAPKDDGEAKKATNLMMFALNVGVNVLLIGFLIHMLRQSRKSLKFISPGKIQGDMTELVGMEDIKAEVGRIKNFLSNRKAYGEYGITRPTNILFSGPPGTGKTKLAGYLAKELGLPILFHSAANLETGFVNGGSQTLERALAMAKREGRCMIFLDEAQDLFMKRGQGGRKFDDDTQNTLLSILDGVRTNKDAEIIWVVASNFNSNSMEMDEAMLRRFQLKIDFRLPNGEEREGIFNHYLDKARSKVEKDVDLKSLAHVTERCSPADIENIVYEAGLAAINRKRLIDADGLMQAVERTLIGNTDTETTKGRERDREIIALHEVGHFLVDVSRHCEGDMSKASQIKDRIGTIKISLKANARSNALGFVLKKPQVDMLQTRADMEWEIMGLFGGMANEEIFFGEDGVTSGAYNDIQQITKLLGRAVSGLGVYKDSKLNISALSRKNDGMPSDEDRQVMEKVSQRLFEKTKAMLGHQRDLSRHLADALISATEMKADDMLDLISAFCHGQEAGKPTDAREASVLILPS